MKSEELDKFDLSKAAVMFDIDDTIAGGGAGGRVRNHIEFRCRCTKVLLAIRSEPKESWPLLRIHCRKMELTCQCGEVHTIENKPFEENLK